MSQNRFDLLECVRCIPAIPLLLSGLASDRNKEIRTNIARFPQSTWIFYHLLEHGIYNIAKLESCSLLRQDLPIEDVRIPTSSVKAMCNNNRRFD